MTEDGPGPWPGVIPAARISSMSLFMTAVACSARGECVLRESSASRVFRVSFPLPRNRHFFGLGCRRASETDLITAPMPRAIVAAILCCLVAVAGVAAQDSRDRKPPGYLDPLVAKYKRALETHRTDPRLALTLYYKLLRNPDDIARLSPQALATLHNNVGSIHYEAGESNAALLHFREAQNADPENAEARVNLGVLLSEDLEQHEEALAHGRKAIELRPGHAKGHHLVGNILQKLGQNAEAHLRFKTAEAIASGKRASASGGRALWRWNATELGEITHVPVGNEAELVMETISLKPPVFRVRQFLSPDERSRIIELARSELRESHVVATADAGPNLSTGEDGSSPKNPPRKSQTAWLVSDADDTGTLELVRRRAMALTVLPETVKSERLQVLRYSAGGYFGAHHESTAFLRRYATLLYYLEGPGEGNGGETAFPLGPDGDGGVRGEAALAAAGEAIGSGDVRRVCDPSFGVRATPTPGDAILFYNFGADGEVDRHAIHAACEVTGGVKWAANHWFTLPEEDAGGGREGRDEL